MSAPTTHPTVRPTTHPTDPREHAMTMSMTTTTTPSTPDATPPRAKAPGSDGGREAADRPQLADVGHLSFASLIGTELRKLVDTRAGKGLLIAIVLVTAAAMALTMWVTRDEGAPLEALLGAAAGPQALLLPVLGIMTAANEWSQRTALITFTQEPRRMRVMGAKAVAALSLGLAVLVLTLGLAVGGHLLAASLAGVQGDASMTLAQVANLTFVQVQGVLMGLGMGALFLNVPLAIVAYVLLPVVSSLLVQITAWSREHAPWFDMGMGGLPLMGDQWLTATQWAQVGTTTAIWVLLPLAVGLWRIATREVK